MATLSDSLVSSSARQMPVRMRPDLSAKRQRYLGRSYWVVKEPVGLNYFRFQDEEWAILQMIDGYHSLDDIKEQFEAEFPPQKITLEELQQFLGMLHRSGLIVASVPDQGRQLKKRRDEKRRKEVLGAMTNVLCIRFKGFDPERALNWIYPWVRWCFHPVTLTFCFLMAMAAMTLVVVEFDTFRSKLPGFHDFFSAQNAIMMGLMLAFSKILHEFGHGLTCKHFGGECHEMGIMILVLTPCLYCNVSDSWMLPSKWKRAAIGAAGIMVEVTLAAASTFIWWNTQPGLIHYFCLNIMFISSVSTILFNANPLLRYDGYYIMADLVEIPNLRQKATAILTRTLGHWFLGIEPPEDPFLPERNQIFFAIYSVAAVIYRWFVMASILFFLYKVFEPVGLKIVGQVIGAMALYGLLVQPFWKLYKYFAVPGRIHQVKKPRMFAALGGLAVVITLAMSVPLPHSVFCTFELKVSDAESVYVKVAGQLEEVLVKPGEHVEAGEVIARLSSLEVKNEILYWEEQIATSKNQLDNLRQLAGEDPSAVSRIPQVEEALLTYQNQLEKKLDEREMLTLRAETTGTVFPPPWMPEREAPGGQLASWSGTPMEPRNVGAFLTDSPSVLFCQIGDPQRWEANLVIDQADIDFVSFGDRVELKFDAFPHDTLEGVLTDLSPEDMSSVSSRQSGKAGGKVATTTDPSGVERPLSASYEAKVPLGLFGEGLNGRYLRGKLRRAADGQAWTLQYAPDDQLVDKSSWDSDGDGRVTLADSPLLGSYKDGAYVSVRGEPAAAYEVLEIQPVQEVDRLLHLGLVGRAKIHVAPQTFGARAWRLVRQTFSFKL